jgi:hypothetical protein
MIEWRTQSRFAGTSIMPVPAPVFPKTENGDATLFSDAKGLELSIGKLGVIPVLADESPIFMSKFA